ncbi:MAG TPA: type II toxin-antitoxin system PemK/MazF family toxin [Geminicoccaceae bacterium]|nr:type II toxin-antitoxin system PemK/MazF family toxin [Geminicoccus sp.]HMU50986.1 type II toxin-antitoxin system PemK/MazF family toxin [Geminicoccaceae bacterium]
MAAPERGDLVWLDFSPHAGREQAERRPAIVLSPRAYHQKTPYVVVCPITSRIKGYPFEVVLPAGLVVSGAVLADQLKSVDRHGRRIERVGTAPAEVLAEIDNRLRALLSLA